ncbi:MAG: hypothetical protein ACWA5L_11340 [bacterium]
MERFALIMTETGEKYAGLIVPSDPLIEALYQLHPLQADGSVASPMELLNNLDDQELPDLMEDYREEYPDLPVIANIIECDRDTALSFANFSQIHRREMIATQKFA